MKRFHEDEETVGSNASSSIVALRDLTHRFASGTIGLRGISLDIHENEFLLVAGRNGSGKTVLMHHLVGLLDPTEGSVHYRGTPIRECIDEVRRRIGIVFQDPASQFLGQTVAEDVGFGLEYESLSADEAYSKVREAMELMGIRALEDRRPHFLSGGEQRKVAIAGLLARDPEVLTLDEPFIGLDLLGVRSILTALVELRKHGHSVVVITHDAEKVLAHADRVVVLSDGSIVADGPPVSVLACFEQYDIRRPAGALEQMTWLEP